MSMSQELMPESGQLKESILQQKMGTFGCSLQDALGSLLYDPMP